MSLLLDTNIIIYLIRINDIDSAINFINPENLPVYISIVSEAEIKSIALKSKWGIKKLKLLDYLLDRFNIVDVNKSFIALYSEVDAYSQRLNPNFETYPFDTPRNMGKNDLWIASLAALLSLKLVTTDADFDHLHNVFFEVKKLNPADFYAFL